MNSIFLDICTHTIDIINSNKMISIVHVLFIYKLTAEIFENNNKYSYH